MRTVSIPQNILKHWQLNPADASNIEAVRMRVKSLLKGEPEVSVCIPAYNEEESIIQTLSSLSDNITNRSVEIIVVDNNSKDATNQLATAAGVNCVRETTQGITPARNRGLKEARGKFILNADADSIYPPDWIEEMVKPLAQNDTEVALTYGRFSFIPVGNTGRGTNIF